MRNVHPMYLPALFQDSVDRGRMILRDGSTASIRLSRPDDRAKMQDFFRRLSPESRRFRFFSPAKPGADVIDVLCDSTDPRRRLTLVVTRWTDKSPRIIATGSYIAMDDKKAEFAVAVEDSFHGKGLGGLLLERLSILATSNNFIEFLAVTDPANQPMLDVFRNSGLHMSEKLADGCIQVTLSVLPGAESMAHSELRDRIFTKASLRPFFYPRTVAVVGASRDPGSFGHRIVEALVQNRFNGSVYPVNPNAQVICSMKAYPSLASIPEPVDLVVITMPREQVLDVIDDCAACGVKSVVVISAGYADAGEEGAKLQAALAEKVRGYGMRMVGPNCLGLLNTDPAVRLNASFSQVYPAPGRIALSSQSGALGLALLRLARQRDMGLSMFISMGNKADVTGNDLLHFWEDDAGTDVILLYLESFGNPRRFSRIARRVSRSKPIVCVKSGRGSSTVTTNVAVDSLFRQTGVIRAETLEEMFDLAALLGNQSLPRGRQVSILTNSHGAGVLCRDTCEAKGLKPVSPAEETLRHLTPRLPPGATAGEIVDLTAGAKPEDYRAAAERLLADGRTDALVIIYVPIIAEETHAVNRALCEGIAAGRTAGGQGKPVVAVMMTHDATGGFISCGGEKIPRYIFPETAARALAAAAEYSLWRMQPPGVIPYFEDVEIPRARDICRHALQQRGDGWLKTDETRDLLAAFHLPLRTASGLDAMEHPEGSAEIQVRVMEDPLFGPQIGVGLDRAPPPQVDHLAFRVTPLTEQDAAQMLREMPGSRLLEGHEHHAASDRDAIEELLLRISLMVEEIPEIREMDLHPIVVYQPGEGCHILTARVRVAAARHGQPARLAVAGVD